MNDNIDEAIRKATRTGRPHGFEAITEGLEGRLNQS